MKINFYYLIFILLLTSFGCDIDAKRIKKTKKKSKTTVGTTTVLGTVTIPETTTIVETHTVTGTPTQISWYTSLDEGERVAKKKNIPIMLSFCGDWCIYCKLLDTITYKDKDVISMLQNFVCVRIDAGKNLELAKKYMVTGLPTIVFIKPDRTKVHEIIGFRQPNDFILEAKKVLKVK
ncbi:TPA: hypothetical protein DCX16_06600 [bacterium]|nr:hypothetical protein [bacterium]